MAKYYGFFIRLIPRKGEEPKDLGPLLVERGLAVAEQRTTGGGEEYTSYNINPEKIPDEALANELKKIMDLRLGGNSIFLESSEGYSPYTYRFYSIISWQCLADCISKMLPDEILRVQREAPYFHKHYVLFEQNGSFITRTGRPTSRQDIITLKNNLLKEVNANPNKIMVNMPMNFDGTAKWAQFELYKDCIIPFYTNNNNSAEYIYSSMVFDAEKYNVKVDGQNIVMDPDEIQRRYYEAKENYSKYMNTCPQLPITQDISLRRFNNADVNKKTHEIEDYSFYIVKLPVLFEKENQDITHVSFTTPITNIEEEIGVYRETMDLPKNGHYQNVVLWRDNKEVKRCQIQVKDMIAAYKNYLKNIHHDKELATIEHMEAVQRDHALEDEQMSSASEDYDYDQDDMERD